MFTQDASAVLPHEKRQVFDSLCAEAATLLRDRQHTDLTTAMARKSVKPKGDRMRVGKAMRVE